MTYHAQCNVAARVGRAILASVSARQHASLAERTTNSWRRDLWCEHGRVL